MTSQQIFFLLFGALTLGSAVAVVTVRNLFHAALWLLLAFFGVAGLYVLLEAPFFAAVQLFVYMGAIGILIIFAIMMTRGMMRHPDRPANEQWLLGAVLSLLLLAVLLWLILQVTWIDPMLVGEVPEDSIQLLGLTFVDPGGYVLPFEVASVLLMVALIGAVTIVRER